MGDFCLFGLGGVNDMVETAFCDQSGEMTSLSELDSLHHKTKTLHRTIGSPVQREYGDLRRVLIPQGKQTIHHFDRGLSLDLVDRRNAFGDVGLPERLHRFD